MKGNQNKFNVLFNTSDIAFLFAKPNGAIVEVNAAAQKLFGYEYEDFLKIKITTLFEISDDFFSPSNDLNHTENKLQKSYIGIKKSGEKIALQLSFTPFIDDDASQLYWITVEERIEELHDIMNFSLDVICTIDNAGNFVKVSDASTKIFGYSPSELVGKPYMNLVHPDDVELTQKATAEIISGRNLTNFQNRYIKKDGSVVPLLWSAKWNEQRNTMFCIAKDCTEKFAQETALIESEKLYKNLFENSPAPMFIFDFETLQIIDCNDETLLKYGYSKEEFLQLTIKDIRPIEDIERIEKVVESEEIYGQIHKNIWRHKKKNGEIMFMDISAHLFNFRNRRMSLVMLMDVTEKLNIEELNEFEKIDKEALINSTDNMLWSVTTDFKLIAANHAFKSSMLEQHNIILNSGDNLLTEAIFPKEYLDFWRILYMKALAGHSFKEEIRNYTLSNVEVWHEISFNPIYKKNEINGIACHARNVTESKIFKQQLQNSEEKYRLLFFNSPFPKWIYDTQTLNILEVNDTALNHYGYSREEFLSMNLKDLRLKEDFLKLEESIKQGKNHNRISHSGILNHRKKNGDFIKVEISGHNIIYEEKNCRIVVSHDVTERENALRNLKDNETKLRTAQEIAKLGYWQLDIKTNNLYWSIEVYKIWELEESVSPNFELFVSSIYSHDLKDFNEANTDFLNGINELDFEHRILLKDGTVKWVHERGKLLKNDQGESIFLEGTVQDITSRKIEEQQLKLLSSVITNTNDAVLITEAEPYDEPGPRIIYVNEAFTKMTGYTAEEVIGKTPRILQGPKTDRTALDKMRNSLKNWQSCEITVINYKKNGEEFWNNFTITPVADNSGIFTHWIAIERDDTARKNEELQNELIAALSNVYNEPVKLHFTLYNTLKLIADFGDFCFAEAWLFSADEQRLHKASSHPSTDAMKLFLAEINSNETSYYLSNLAEKVSKTKKSYILENLSNNKNFEYRNLAEKYGVKSLLLMPLISHNEIVSVLAFGLDKIVTNNTKYLSLFKSLSNYLAPEIKRKQLEQELNQLFNFAPDIIVIASVDGYFKKINPAACTLLGYTEEELYAVPYNNFVHPDDRIITNEEANQLLEINHTFYFENRYITKTGKIKWLAWNATYSQEENNIYGVAKDITEKKELEDLLRKANKLAKIGGWELDLETNTIFWSDITKEIHEVPTNYIPTIENRIDFYKNGNSKTAITNYVNRAIEHGQSWDDEFEIITAKGNERWIKVIGEVEKIDNKITRIYGSFQDIDEKKRVEEKISNSEERRTLIMNAALDAIICINKKGLVTFWNPQAEQLFGWKEDEVMGKDLSTLIIPDSYQIRHNEGMKNYTKTKKGQALNVLLQLSAIKKNGDEFPIELTVLPIQQENEEFFCAFIRDISERKNYENRLINLNESLKQQKEELIISNHELEQFAYVASHDLQEPLRMVTSFLSLLNNKYGSTFDDKATSYIDFAVDGAKRMRQLILDLLEYSRVGKTDETLELLDLNNLIDEIKILCRKKIEELDAQVIVVGSLPKLKCHKSPLLQLFQNLISNALKYSRNEVIPVVKISATSQDNYWQFVVEDNGIGIEEEYFEKIFVIFQRLHNKDEYTGTGLGLAVSKKIVESLKGKIWVESTPNVGSKFFFTIPK